MGNIDKVHKKNLTNVSEQWQASKNSKTVKNTIRNNNEIERNDNRAERDREREVER